MRKSIFRISLVIFMIGIVIGLGVKIPADASMLAQQPTIAMPTVTGTSVGPVITVNLDQDQINVRSGPGTSYPKVGVLLAGQQAPALGKSPAGEWILIVYPGVPGSNAWVYSPLVTATGGELNVVEPPPTPTLLYTATIDPTLAAQFIVTSVPTRLPTFTQPPPLAVPTYAPAESTSGGSSLPMGMIIVGLLVIGGLGMLISILRGS